MSRLGIVAGFVVLLGTLAKAAPVVYWNGTKVASPEAFGEVAYNQSVSIIVTFDADQVGDGTLVEVKGGGGNNAAKNVYKRLALTVENGALNGVVAGKNGTDVVLGGGALLTALPQGVVRAALVIETTTGTNITPRAVATGGAEKSGSGFNFDNLAGDSWEANAPFDTWLVADEVLSVEIYTPVAWASTEMVAKVNGPLLFWNGDLVPSFAGKSVAYNESFSMLVTFNADAVANGTLLEVKGGGGNTSVQNVQKRVAVTLENGQLCGMAAGKDGNSIVVGDAPLLTKLPTGEVRAAMAIANTESGTGVTVRSQATGGTMRSKDKFNFDNVAGASWSANAPFDTWMVAQGITSVEVVTDKAWAAEEIAEKVVVTPEDVKTGEVLEVVDEVVWPETVPEQIRFKGGTLVIPQGVTLETLRLTEDSGAGTLLIQGALIGQDTSEPWIPAFELPRALTVKVVDGGTLQMDGRISATVEISGAVTLSAATEDGTLSLDVISLDKDAVVTLPKGCLEVYACPKVTPMVGAAFRRWVAPGYRIRLY